MKKEKKKSLLREEKIEMKYGNDETIRTTGFNGNKKSEDVN